MSVIVALSDEPASCDGLTNDALGTEMPVHETMVTPVNKTTEADKTEFVQPASNPEKVTNELAKLTNAANQHTPTATNDCHLLTNSAVQYEAINNAIDSSSQSTNTFQNLEHSPSGDDHLISPSYDEQKPRNADDDDQQCSTNDIANQEQHSNDTNEVIQPPVADLTNGSNDIGQQSMADPTNNTNNVQQLMIDLPNGTNDVIKQPTADPTSGTNTIIQQATADSTNDMNDVIQQATAESINNTNEVIQQATANSTNGTNAIIQQATADPTNGTNAIIQQATADPTNNMNDVIQQATDDPTNGTNYVIQQAKADPSNGTNDVIQQATADSTNGTNDVIQQATADPSNGTNDVIQQATAEPINNTNEIIQQATDDSTNDTNDAIQQATADPINNMNTLSQQPQPTADSTNGTNDVIQQHKTNPTNDIVNQQAPVDTVEKQQLSENQETVGVEQPKHDPTIQRPLYIPPHVMGRDLNNPAQDVMGSNRRIPKPRLGVKVPYRNLMSQIVTQDEIAQEILERQMRKYSYPEALEGRDVFFTMKLTHRLANKISPNESIEKKHLEPAKAAGSKFVNVIASAVSDLPSKSTTNNLTENLSAPSVAATSSSNVVSSVPSADTTTATLTTNTTSVSAARTTNEVFQPSSNTASQLLLKSDFSPADELYAEISSTLKEEYDPSAKPGQMLSVAQFQAYQSNAKSQTPNDVSSSVPVHTEAELDNDTLLAILEGTTDATESCGDVSAAGQIPTVNSVSAASVVSTAGTVPVLGAVPTTSVIPQTAIIATPTPAVEDKKKKHKKRIKPILDPALEKELALKQLMAFDSKKRAKKQNTSTASKSKVVTPSTAQNGVVVPPKNANNVPVTQASDGKLKSVIPSKKTKRATNLYIVNSQAPKCFPKKYQRIIKQQLRSSKKLKSKNLLTEQQTQQQKKLPEVPEVQIAIDRYIKTYASKRKHKPDTQNDDKPAEKRMKMDGVGPNVIAVGTSAKVVAASAKATATNAKNIAISTKAVAVNSKATAASTKSAVANTRVSTTNEKVQKASTQVTNDKCAAVDKKTDAAVVAAPAPADPPVSTSESMEVDENTAADIESDNTREVEVMAELAEKETEEAMAKSKMTTKMMREINRLLGDEGAINMIYSVEQKRLPDSRRNANVLPSTRRQKKDLQLRTKLVKNAVLRLSMSSSSQGTPTRNVRRVSPETTPDAVTAVPSVAKGGAVVAAALRKASIESVGSNSSELNNNTSINSYSSKSKTLKARQIAAEASRIIRRHSSSSAYSSDDEEEMAADRVKPMSLTAGPASDSKEKVTSSSSMSDDNVTTSATVDVTSDQCVPKSTSAGSTVAEKDSASQISDNCKVKSPATSRRTSKETPVNIELNESHILQNAPLNGGLSSELSEHQLSLKEITIRKYDNLVQIILISSMTKMKNALNINILHELISVLRELEKDDGCRTVLVTSTGSSFCQGIDLQTLICADKAERVKIVNEFVNTLMSFTRCLSQFRKILIAGVHGSTVGLGVTMLPFFDMVFASDKATFYTPYVKLGQIPEAGATLTLPHLLGNAVTNELLFGCRMLTAGEALQFGLVTRTLWPDKFSEELLPLARGIASHSAKALEATKLLLRRGMTAKLEEQLEMEANLLREHWCSEECQSSFKNYLEQEALLQNK